MQTDDKRRSYGERRAAVMVEAAEAKKSIRKVNRRLVNYMTKVVGLQRPHETVTASRKEMVKIIHEYNSDLFDSHVHLSSCEIKENGYIVPPVLLSEIRHAILSVKNRTAPGPDRIRPEHLRNLPPVLVNTLAQLFTRYLTEYKVPTLWTTSKTVLFFSKSELHDNGSYRPAYLLSFVYKLFSRVILNKIDRTLDDGHPCERAGFQKGFSTMDHIHAITRLIEVS
ncbi:unnamed protein product [Angiostrongylus costaricensis]|uniref:Reverse transcriptase domain-containing protein n=1 Tax=Angiostrongylus costaricensis TaxID=334426 RepID=A0A0R3PM33_ANGCS|nr:unnamed protein product [Angiostrongylus costaricensis]